MFLLISNKLKSLIVQSFINVDAKRVQVTAYGGGSISRGIDNVVAILKRLDELVLRSREIDGASVKID